MAYVNKYRSDLEIQMPKEENNSLLTGLATVAAVGGAGYLAFRSGALRPLLAKAMDMLDGSSNSQILGAMEGLKGWSDKLVEKKVNWKNILGKDGFLRSGKRYAAEAWEAAAEGAARRLDGRAAKSLRERGTYLEEQMVHMNEAALRWGRQNAAPGARHNLQEEGLLKDFARSGMKARFMAQKQEQDAMMQAIGARHATVKDLLGRDVLRNDKLVQKHLVDHDQDWLNAVVDRRILINDRNEIRDLRDTQESFQGFLEGLENELQLPVVGFNPLRMFHVSAWLTPGRQEPMVELLDKHLVQPLLRYDPKPLGMDALFLNGSVFKLGKGGATPELIGENFYLASTKDKFVADKIRKFTGIGLSEFEEDNVVGKAYSALHLGKQDEPLDQFNLSEPHTWLGAVTNQFLGHDGKFTPLTRTQHTEVQHAFGKDKGWLLMRKHRTWEQSESVADYLGQFVAGRDSLNHVTTSTLYPYTFFERLNGGLATMGLGLPTSDMGSAGAIFGNLLKYRVAPVIGGAYAWNYLNYEAENLFGEGNSPEKLGADAYVGMSVDLGRARDAMGITDWAKHTAHLFPGGQFISELPIIGNLVDLNDSAEELENYWANGEDPVRKGRYWPSGNTPYIGGKADRFEPNWYRKLKSDWEYTDTLYGSKDEYWENAAIPTLRYPLAPLRHFFTDPYHWEEKHFYDRPYPLTGGIAELEGTPLVGPFLNSTVGQLLKPTREMHLNPNDVGPNWAAYDQTMQSMGYIPVTGDGTGAGGEPQAGMSPTYVKPPAGEPLEPAPHGGATPLPTGAGTSIVAGMPGAAAAPGAFTVPGLNNPDPIPSQVEDGKFAAYVTASGRVDVMQYDGAALSIYDAQQMLATSSAQRAGLKAVRPPNALPTASVADPETSAMKMAGQDFLYNVTEMGGFYGFSFNALTGQGPTGPSGVRVADAGQISSPNRAFYDMDLGGMGGNLNEIGRRFMPKEDHSQDLNWIKNTMPDWLPGAEYFTDYQTGDPYAKIKHGEIRLPGSAYESIYEVPEVAQLMAVPEIKAMVDARVINRGDLYGPMARFRILADVAPYSEQFRQLDSKMSQFPITEEEHKEVQEIRGQVQERKDNLQVTPYRFKYANVADRQVTVSGIIEDPRSGFMFTTEEYPDNPIKLAGVQVPMGKNNPASGEALAYLRAAIQVGERVNVRMDADEMNMVSSDTYGTIRAAVTSGNTNVNKYMIDAGLAKEDDNDFSAPAIHARFSDTEIAVGSLWETFAHWDSKLNTKYLQGRSAVEMYKRRDLYGKGYQEWTEPVDDYLIPTYQSFITHNPIMATAVGAYLGFQFGHSPLGAVAGAVVGGLAVGVGAAGRSASETITGERYIPGRRKDERAANEYFDMLKYVKNMGLFENAAKESVAAGFDVKKYLANELADGDMRKERKRYLEDAKKQIKLDPGKAQWVAKNAKIDAGIFAGGQDIVKAINQEINELANARELRELPPKAAEALMYFREAERTVFAYDAGDPIADLMAALPKRDREYLPEFIKAPEEERQEILDLVPSYVRRPLQSMWGQPVDEKPTLEQYFSEHGLPGAEWSGWRPDVSMDAVKIKFIQHEALDRSEFSVFPKDIERANLEQTSVPNIRARTSPDTVRSRLEKILGGAGIQDLEIEVLPKASGVSVSVDLKRDRRQELEDYTRDNQRDIFLS